MNEVMKELNWKERIIVRTFNKTFNKVYNINFPKSSQKVPKLRMRI